MDLKNFISTMLLRNSEINHTAESKIYQFESNDFGILEMQENVKFIAEFYALCGYLQYESLIDRSRYLKFIFFGKQIIPLPVNNAVAFFDSLISLGKNVNHQRLHAMVYTILPYVLSCRGFVFGTVFDSNQRACVRPCDLEYIDPLINDFKICENVLRTQAELKSGHAYKQEFLFYSNTTFGLHRQSEKIKDWFREIKSEKINEDRQHPWDYELKKCEAVFWSFFNCYENYSLQLAPQADKTGKEKLDEIRRIAQFVFKMEHLVSRLADIAKIAKAEDNIAQKTIWLNCLHDILSSEENVKVINSMRDDWQSKDGDALDENVLVLEYTKERPIITIKDWNKYPLLDIRKPFHKLRREEKDLLFWYRRHPVAFWIDLLYRGPRKLALCRIMPFYLMVQFLHTKDPAKPFRSIPRGFSIEKIKCTGDITFSKDQRAVHNQTCHHAFYLSLMSWCDQYFHEKYDRAVCNALYTYVRPHIATEPPTKNTEFLGNQMYILQQALRRVFEFDVSMFPQYAERKISSSDFTTFFFVDQRPETKRIRRLLQQLVTEEDANEYKKIGFIDGVGFGYGSMPEQWHQTLAEWLDKIIRKNETIYAYATSEVSDCSNQPLDFGSYHLAQVEVSIQYLCCKQIAEGMSAKTLKFCKRALCAEEILSS